MQPYVNNKLKNIAVVVTMAMFFLSCKDKYKNVEAEAQALIYPQGIGENYRLVYSELTDALKSEDSAKSRIVAVLRGPYGEDYENLVFPFRSFPEGLEVDIYDDKGNKSVIRSDHGILFAATNIIDLWGNVQIVTHDGKILETSQLYFDQGNEWVFTQKKFKFTNPQEGTTMDGEGMDFNKGLDYLSAHKTYGLMMIKENN